MDIYSLKFVQFLKDLSNFRKFKKMIKHESDRADSKYNALRLQRNWFGNMLYVQIDCTNSDFMNADFDRERMLSIKLKPYVEYLSSELGWGEYLMPQISNFVDEENKPSLSFGVVFIFTGYAMTLSNLLFFWIFNALLVIGSAIAACYFIF